MAYQCEQCGESFSKLSQLKQHQRTENHWRKYSCEACGKCFTRKDNLDQHIKKHEKENYAHCEECGKVFSRPYTLNRHKERVHQVERGQKRPLDDALENIDSPVTKRLRKEDDPRQYYTLTKVKSQRIEKFKTTANSYKITFKNIEVTENILTTLRQIFTAIFQQKEQSLKIL